MAVYLAKKTPDAKGSPAAFLAKKLSNYMPAPISTLGVHGVARFKEVAYGLYRNSIDAFCAATFKKMTVFAQAEGFGNIIIDPILPFITPPVAFTPNFSISADQCDLFQRRLGDETTRKVIGKTTEFTVPSPKPDQVESYIKVANPNYSTGPDRLSPLGYRTYIKVISIIQLFLATNYYPAFKDSDTQVPAHSDFTFGAAGISDTDKKKYFYSFTDGFKRSSSDYIKYDAPSQRRKLAGDKRAFDGDVEMTAEQKKNEESNCGVMTLPAINTAVVYAKPSGRPSTINFGGPGNLPELPGLVFPYFKGMTRPDFTIIRDILINFFFRLFGEDFATCKKNIKEVKRGINSLSLTEVGMELCHVLKGIELSLATQTRLYLLFDNGYKGYVLLGSQFAVWDGSEWVSPVSSDEVRKELQKMDTHSASLAELEKLLLEMKVDDMDVDDDDEELDISTARKLVEAIRIRDFSDYSEKDRFDKALQGLIWPKPFTQLNPDTLLTFMDNAFVELRPVLEDDSIYIPSCQAPLDDELFLHLCTFGPEAPSLYNTRGEIISFVPDKKRKGKEGTVETIPCPKEIIILPKPVLIAYKDWKKIISDGAVAFNFKERAKEHRGHVVTSPKMKERIWKVLLENIGKLHETEQEKGGSVPKKAKNVSVVSFEDALKLF
jgi:hypothetical protein